MLFAVWCTLAAGSAILFLKAMGWSDLEVTTIIIPFHAAVLQVSCFSS